jgi:signal transduction histidine kinase
MNRSNSTVDSDVARILVVDDDERNLLALSEVLGPVAEVVTAASGRDALRLLLRQEFAVILLDVFMPGIDGYETAALIRDREQTARIPIIFLSAVNKETEHLMRGYRMGAVDYVFKPVDPLVLKSKVSVFVDLFNMRRQVEKAALAENLLREAHYREQLGRMEVERQLQDSQLRQSSILKLLPMAIYEAEYVAGSGLKRQIVGGDLSRFLGGGEGDVSSAIAERSWEELVHPDDRDRAAGRRSDAHSLTVEYRLVGPEGDVHHILDQRVAVPSASSSKRWAGTLLDISERKKLESQLTHAGKLDALGQLTGGVAHDFNNLLAAMLGGIHILQRRPDLGDRDERILSEMRHATEQGADLVKRMMAFARQQELSPSSVSPADLCETVAGLVSHAMSGSWHVDWQCPKTDTYLFVDRGQLELAMMNLVINARDAMPDGGEITVSVNAVEPSLDGQPAICIRVKDRGVGISPDILDRVTEPFFTTKETGKGTGLGLSMVAGFVHQSGGSMAIDSIPGAGTTIDLILPATESRGAKSDSDESVDMSWLADKRLMLIDDDVSVRLVLSEQFRDAGGVVDEFSNGQEAIEAVRARPNDYDYAISDFAMPGMNGLETLTEVRKLAPEMRVALITGYANDERLSDRHACIPLVRKPINLGRIRDALRT